MRHSLFRRCLSLLLAAFLGLALPLPAAADDPAPPVTAAEGVSLDQSQLTLETGATAALTAELLGGLKGTVAWESSQDAVASVTATGGDGTAAKVTAAAIGETVITVTVTKTDTAEIFRATCAVTVTAPRVPVTGVSITSPSTLNTVEKGGTLQLEAAVYPELATDRAVTWKSSAPDVATVDETGRISGVGAGRTTITVTSHDGEKTDTRDVECSGIALSESSVSLVVGEDKSLSFPLFGAAKGGNVEWSSTASSVAGVTAGRITGIGPGTAVITATVFGTGYAAQCTVTVKEDLADAIEASTGASAPYKFEGTLALFNARCREKTGADLAYITNLSVSTASGVLYDGYVSPDAHGTGIGATDVFDRVAGVGRRTIADVSFVPNVDFSGTAVVSYTGYAENGKSFNGTVRIQVAQAVDVTYSIAKNRPLELTAAEFAAVCQSRTGRAIRSVCFDQPPATQGTLYYHYSAAAGFSQKVDSKTAYYINSAPNLEDITFVPEKNFVGTVTIPYTCTDASGSAYRGRVTISVLNAGTISSGAVTYKTVTDTPVDLVAGDFNTACYDATGQRLNHIYFQPPASREGTLYYRYVSQGNYGSIVTENTRYYRTSTPNISSVTFVPKSGFSGTVVIPFNGYDTDGQSFSGDLVIEVAQTDATNAIRYEVEKNDTLSFDAADFNALCRKVNGTAVDRLRFTQPAESRGTLYYDGTRSKLSETTFYYRSGTPSLSRIVFVPKSGFSGTVAILFTGYDTAGWSFSGTVYIKVNAGEDTQVRYEVYSGETVPFRAADFDAACRSITGYALYSVRFDLPISRAGTLYLGYDAAGGAAAAVSESLSYFASGTSRRLDDVSFRASANYLGTVVVNYQGTNSRGEEYTGRVSIAVQSRPIPQLWFADVRAGSFYYDAVYWAAQKGITGGISQYAFGPDQICTRAQAVTFLWRAAGSPAPTATVDPFQDVVPGAYYYSAVQWAVEKGITGGTKIGTFSPNEPVDRAQMVTFLHRSRGAPASGWGMTFTDVPAGAYYSSAVRWAVEQGITAGVGEQRFAPGELCTRAQMVTFLYRAQRGQ